MNILHMKYAVEVAKCGSINRAAETLLMNQPNLSRAIKELESSLGVKIFERTAKGMLVTQDGEIFLKYANNILKQVDEVENIFKATNSNKKSFSVSVPKASYISEAMADFSLSFCKEENVEIIYKETSAKLAIKNILEADYRLGIVRYAAKYGNQYKEIFEEKELSYELVAEFKNVLVMNKNSLLAEKESISYKDVEDLIEIEYSDVYKPIFKKMAGGKEETSQTLNRRIFVLERAAQFDILSKNEKTFMQTSPVPKNLLDRFGLVQKEIAEDSTIYKDVIIRKKDYHLTDIDGIFISALCKAKRNTF